MEREVSWVTIHWSELFKLLQNLKQVRSLTSASNLTHFDLHHPPKFSPVFLISINGTHVYPPSCISQRAGSHEWFHPVIHLPPPIYLKAGGFHLRSTPLHQPKPKATVISCLAICMTGLPLSTLVTKHVKSLSREALKCKCKCKSHVNVKCKSHTSLG